MLYINRYLSINDQVIAKDTNILLVALAAKDIAGLANGLKNKFSTHAPGVRMLFNRCLMFDHFEG